MNGRQVHAIQARVRMSKDKFQVTASGEPDLMPRVTRDIHMAHVCDRLLAKRTPRLHSTSGRESFHHIRAAGLLQDHDVGLAGVDDGCNWLLTTRTPKPDVIAQNAETHESPTLPNKVR